MPAVRPPRRLAQRLLLLLLLLAALLACAAVPTRGVPTQSALACRNCAVSLGGNTDRICTTDTQFFPTSAITFVTWVRVSSASQLEGTFVSYAQGGVYDNFLVQSIDKLRVNADTNTKNTNVNMQSPYWTHLSVSFNYAARSWRVHINGTLQYSSASGSTATLAAGGQLCFGVAQTAGAFPATSYLWADLEDVGLFNRVLTDAEVADIFTNNISDRISGLVYLLRFDECAGTTISSSLKSLPAKFNYSDTSNSSFVDSFYKYGSLESVAPSVLQVDSPPVVTLYGTKLLTLNATFYLNTTIDSLSGTIPISSVTNSQMVVTFPSSGSLPSLAPLPMLNRIANISAVLYFTDTCALVTTLHYGGVINGLAPWSAYRGVPDLNLTISGPLLSSGVFRDVFEVLVGSANATIVTVASTFVVVTVDTRNVIPASYVGSLTAWTIAPVSIASWSYGNFSLPSPQGLNLSRGADLLAVSPYGWLQSDTITLTLNGTRLHNDSLSDLMYIDFNSVRLSPAAVVTSLQSNGTLIQLSFNAASLGLAAGVYTIYTRSRTYGIASLPSAFTVVVCTSGASFLPNISLTQCYCRPGYYNAPLSQCYACSQGRYSDAYNASGCTDCWAGAFSNVSAASFCYQCAPGAYNAAPVLTACSLCTGGYYQPAWNATLCVACWAGAIAAASGASACALCSNGTFSNATARTWCASCDRGSYGGAPNRTACATCAQGYFAPSFGLSACPACPLGYFGVSAAQSFCAACQPGSFNNVSASSRCVICAAGTYNASSAATRCVDCVFGTYSFANATSCIPCDPGTYASAPGTSICVNCPVGTYSPQSGANSVTQCLGCPAGMFSAGTGASALSNCTNCTAGSWSYASASRCELCPFGYFSKYTAATTPAACTYCLSGTISLAGASTCTACDNGRYSWSGGSSFCNWCNVSTPVDVNGTLNQDMTTLNGSQFAHWAPIGSGYSVSTTGGRGSAPLYAMLMNNTLGGRSFGASQTVVLNQPQPYALLIVAWSSGQNVTGSPSANYSLRVDVYYQDGSNDTSYYASFKTGTKYYEKVYEYVFPPKAIYSYTVRLLFGEPHRGWVHFDDVNVTQIGLEVGCTCPAGQYYYIDPNLGVCHDCSTSQYCINGKRSTCGDFDNWFSFGRSSTCLECLPGWVCQAGVGLPCLNGTYEYNRTCQACPSGSACYNGQRHECAAGAWGVGGSSCVMCEPGTYAAASGTSFCSTCTAGKTSNYARTTCVDCPLGTYSLAGGRCLSCDPGYVASVATPNTCSPCSAGSYNPDRNGYVCSACPVGAYSPSSAASSCTACPANQTTTGTGKTAASDCA